MSYKDITIQHVDYIQRLKFSPSVPITKHTLTTAAPFRPVWHIRGIGQLEKDTGQKQPKHLDINMQALLVGLQSYKIPLAFLVESKSGNINIYIGVWSPHSENASNAIQKSRVEIVKTLLNSLYPAVDLVMNNNMSLSPFSHAGLVVGMPSLHHVDSQNGAYPLDRILRSLPNSDCAFLILAQSVDEHVITTMRAMILNELREVQSAVRESHAPNPVAEHYSAILRTLLQTYTHGQAIGCYRTAAYLLGNAPSYYQLSSIWRGIFCGDRSVPEPVQVVDCREASIFATNWSMPDAQGEVGPGHFLRPFEYQTLLTSAQLANYIHLPRFETSGFQVQVVPDFDVVSAQTAGNLSLGQVVHHRRLTQSKYLRDINELRRHAFISGITRSGKTNSVFGILKQAVVNDIPFFVIEPSKTEYRKLLNDPVIGKQVQVFTVFNESGSPLRCNPFVPQEGTPVNLHIDLIRAVFSASFGMWTPLPQVLEKSLHEVYSDYGWDIAMNTNQRLSDGKNRTDAFPTMSDLLVKVEQVTNALGFEERIASDINASLQTRLESLCVGVKGRTLNTRMSMPIEEMIKKPTIIELDNVADDDDKAFVIGLLYIRLFEALRKAGESKKLKLLLVIEEAHRLLTAVNRHQREEDSNPRGKAVEMFANLLTEVSAYGLGVVIVDQIASKLAPEVIKGTNLKLVHKITDAQDREVMAGSMVMTTAQSKSLARLQVGEAVVFSEGDDAPLLVQMPIYQNTNAQSTVDLTRIAERMKQQPFVKQWQNIVNARALCPEQCQTHGNCCDTAISISHDPAFQRVLTRCIQSVAVSTHAVDRLWKELLSVIMPQLPSRIDVHKHLQCILIHGAIWFTNKRGGQESWTFAETKTLAKQICRVMIAKLNNSETSEPTSDFQQISHQLHVRRFNPYINCHRICEYKPSICLYRHAVADLIEAGHLNEKWQMADEADRNSENEECIQTWEICLDAAYELVESPTEIGQETSESASSGTAIATKEAALCFGQQMLYQDIEKYPRTKQLIMEKLLEESQS